MIETLQRAHLKDLQKTEKSGDENKKSISEKNENHGSIRLSMKNRPHSKIQRVCSKDKRDNLDVKSSYKEAEIKRSFW